MRKMGVAIIEAMDGAGWLASSEIAKRAGFPAKSVSTSMAHLVRGGSVLRKENPDSLGSFLFKLGNTPAGFGISGNISEFDRLLREVRA